MDRNERRLGATNGQTVRLDGIDGQMISLTDQAGKTITLDAGDPMRQRLGHGLVLNMHKAQGLTVENAITVMSSNDRMLNTQSLAYVLASRAQEGFALHVDNREKLIGQIEANSGIRPSALDIVADRKAALAEPLEPVRATREAAPLISAERDAPIPYPEKYLGLSL
jgi:hypothetical protein